MSTELPDLPKAPQTDDSDLTRFLRGVREHIRELRGFGGSGLARALTAGEAVVGITGPAGPAGPPGVDGGSYTPDLTSPPTPSGVSIVAGLTYIHIETASPTFTNGHGYARTIVYGAQWPSSDPTAPTFSSAVKVYEFAGQVGAMPTNMGTRWCLWLTWLTKDGIESASPQGGTNGNQATTGKVGTSDLNDAIIEAAKLADGSITADKFNSGIEPVTIVSAVPGAKVTNTIFNTADGKLYRWSGSAYVKTIPTADLSGTVTDAQIAGMAASKVTGTLTDAQIAAVSAAKITGTLSASQIADGSISGTKFASGLEPVSIVASVPGAKTTSAIFNTSDGKLYRWSGSEYVASVPASDLSGSITSTQITDGAISTVKLAANAVTAAKIAAGTITSAQIAADTITAGNIAAGAVTASELAAGAVTAGKIAANAVTATEIAAGSVTTAKLAADAVTANEIAAGAVTASEIASGAVTTAKLAAGAVTANEIAAGAVVAGKVAANAITATELAADSVTAGKVAAGAITASKLFVTGAGAALNADPSCMDSSAWSSSPVMLSGQADMPAGSTAIANTTGAGEDVLTAELIPIEQLKRYRVEALVKQTVGSTGFIYLGVAWYDASKALLTSNAAQPGGAGSPAGWSNGSYSYFGLIGVAAPATWTRYVASFGPGEAKAIPSNAKYIKLVARLNYGSTAGVQHAVSGFKLMEKADADLIVDGSIVASKLAANAIAVGTAAIQNGAIVNAMIGSASIDDAKIANISAAKLSVGDGTIGGDLKSSNFVAGSDGWRVRPNGVAEFDATAIRGLLTASQINSNGLTIRNSLGQVMLDASGDSVPPWVTDIRGAPGATLLLKPVTSSNTREIRSLLATDGLTSSISADDSILYLTSSMQERSSGVLTGTAPSTTNASTFVDTGITFSSGGLLHEITLVVAGSGGIKLMAEVTGGGSNLLGSIMVLEMTPTSSMIGSDSGDYYSNTTVVSVSKTYSTSGWTNAVVNPIAPSYMPQTIIKLLVRSTATPLIGSGSGKIKFAAGTEGAAAYILGARIVSTLPRASFNSPKPTFSLSSVDITGIAGKNWTQITGPGSGAGSVVYELIFNRDGTYSATTTTNGASTNSKTGSWVTPGVTNGYYPGDEYSVEYEVVNESGYPQYSSSANMVVENGTSGGYQPINASRKLKVTVTGGTSGSFGKSHFTVKVHLNRLGDTVLLPRTPRDTATIVLEAS